MSAINKYCIVAKGLNKDIFASHLISAANPLRGLREATISQPPHPCAEPENNE